MKLRELLESRALTQAHKGHLELSTQFSGLQREITRWADDLGEDNLGCLWAKSGELVQGGSGWEARGLLVSEVTALQLSQ